MATGPKPTETTDPDRPNTTREATAEEEKVKTKRPGAFNKMSRLFNRGSLAKNSTKEAAKVPEQKENKDKDKSSRKAETAMKKQTSGSSSSFFSTAKKPQEPTDKDSSLKSKAFPYGGKFGATPSRNKATLSKAGSLAGLKASNVFGGRQDRVGSVNDAYFATTTSMAAPSRNMGGSLSDVK